MKYTFTAGQRLQIAGAGDFFRLLSTTSPVTVEFYFQGREIAERVDVEAGFAEQFRTVDFDRVDITSPLAQTVQFETAKGSEIRYDRGAASVTGSVDLNAATIVQLLRPENATASYGSKAALAANTADPIFTAGSNPNGAILLAASCYAVEASGGIQAFIANAAAPTTTVDGEVVHAAMSGNSSNTANNNLNLLQWIPAGKGLYFISDIALTVTAQQQRSARYKLL